MVTQLQPDVRAYLHGGEVIKRYIRVEEVAHEYGFSVEETEYIATQLGYKCEIEKEKNIIYTTDEIRFRADFVIKTELLKEYGIREWAFDVYVGPHRPVMQKLSWFFGCCYVNSLRDNGTKLSLVLSNKDEFDAAKRRLGTIKIHDIISIILINEENWELEEEFVIPTYDKVDMPTLGGATYGR